MSLDKDSPEKPIISPCISVCALNKDDVCGGCYRTGNEISHWGRMDNTQRRAVLVKCYDREKKHNPFL